MGKDNRFAIRAKRLIVNLLILASAIAIVFFIGEITVRILPFFSDSFVSFRFRQYDSEIGTSLIPNSNGPHHRGCFKGEISINKWGMRDRERTLENGNGAYRIALLGDSILEGVHVKPNEVANIKMEEMFEEKRSSNVEVLNFGIAGIGTTQELLVYRKRVRRFDPDLVVLLFLTSNDVMDNSSKLQPSSYGIHKWYAPYFDLGFNDELIFHKVETRKVNFVAKFLEKHSALTYHIQRVWARLNLGKGSWHGIPLFWGVYGDPPDKEWEQSWIITEKVLKILKDTVEADGARFIVLVLPEVFEYDQDWKKRMINRVEKIPNNLNPFVAMRRLKEIAIRQGIMLDYLGPYFERYNKNHDLHWPFFSFTCDTHFSALGHKVLANSIIEKLSEYHLLEEKETKLDKGKSYISLNY